MQRRRRSLIQGDVVLVTWPFTDLSGAKLRPALVISSDIHNQTSDDVVLIAVSSNITRDSDWDIVFHDSEPAFRASGLKRSSTFRCSKLFTAEEGRLVQRKLGRLEGEWLSCVIAVVGNIFRPSP